MTLIFEAIQTDGIAQLSYLIGDSSTGTAAVVDPRPDVEIYLKLSRNCGVAITHILETHIHADFMSGARELAGAAGEAKVFASSEGGASYDFQPERVRDGDRFQFGAVVVTARHTPGHTPEHLAYELAESKDEKQPWGVLTGDSLFVGSAGRPDLLGDDATEQLTEQLFHTLRDYYLGLDDSVIIYPCHGAGSACGADIGERPMSTIGFERRNNAFLQHDNLDDFKAFVDKGAPPVPQHYPILKKVNARGPQTIGRSPVVPGLPPNSFWEAAHDDETQLVDTRQMLAFGGGHPPGAINIGDRPELSVWAGDMLSYDKPILLVVEDADQLDWISWHFGYVGLTDFAGYLVGGMKAWSNAGLPLATVPQLHAKLVAERRNELQVLDVRSPSEFEKGHIAGATHLHVADIRDGVPDDLALDPAAPVAVYCGSGYRASIAASLLKRGRFEEVYNVPGSLHAWKACGFELTES